MNWVITSFIMFLSSIIYYLIIKKAQINKIESKLYMLANFSIPTIFYLIMNIVQKKNIFVDWGMLLLIFLNALIFSYIGSIISYSALEKAPNAGYSLTIQKSYAVYTSIVAIFLFHSSLSLLKFLAILLIIVATTFILIDKKQKNEKNNYEWIILSFGAFFFFGTLRLINKLIVNAGIPSITLLFWTMFFVALISLINLIISKNKVTTNFTKQNILVMFGIGISVTFFYYFLQISEISAPNIGYVSAINTASNAFYTVLVALIFKDKLSRKKFLAVLGVTGGLILLLI